MAHATQLVLIGGPAVLDESVATMETCSDDTVAGPPASARSALSVSSQRR
ncbi:hypothetical protein [Compostimonas suwonensis]|nr:hypothetical protein [Compostimonas suwonensis]